MSMAEDEPSQAQLVFRLYRPRDASLATHCVPQPAPVDADALLSKFNALDVTAVDAELADESVRSTLLLLLFFFSFCR